MPKPRVTRMELWAAEEEAAPRPEVRSRSARSEVRTEPESGLEARPEAEEKPEPVPQPEAEENPEPVPQPEAEQTAVPSPEPRIGLEWGPEEPGLARRRMAKAPLEGVPGERVVPRRTTRADAEPADASTLKPTPLIQCDHEEITRRARASIEEGMGRPDLPSGCGRST